MADTNIFSDIDPGDLTDITRYILDEETRQDLLAEEDPQQTNGLGPWFPEERQESIEVEWDEETDATYIPSIPLRAFDTPVPEGSLPGVTSRKAEMIPMGIKYKIGEREIHQMRLAGGDVQALMERRAFNHIQRGMRGAMNRAQLLMSDLMVNAQIVLDENGVQETITVPRDGANEPTSATAWSSLATADPHDDEHGAVDVLRPYGLAWDDLVVLTNRATFNHYRKIEAVASELPTNRALTGRVSTAEVNDLRAGRELPPVIILDRQVADPGGTLQYLIPSNYWMIVPRPGIRVGAMVWGTPASAEMSDLRPVAQGNPGPLAFIEEKPTVPPSRSTVIDAIGFPFLQAPNWTVRLDTQAGL